MARKVLLLEPNYKNKYPPMGLMKLSTYFRRQGDDVRFFKGKLRSLAAELLFEAFWEDNFNQALGGCTNSIREYIKYGRKDIFNSLPFEMIAPLKDARAKFVAGIYPKFDLIGITTLFTFYWSLTIATVNDAKMFLAKDGRMLIGGIASTVIPEEFEKATGIAPFRNEMGGALLDRPGQIDAGNDLIIDDLPLDYSILEEIDYVYPTNKAYFSYMTRGCVNHCSFCAVPKLEPGKPCQFKSIKGQLRESTERFGERKDLMLLDNNVLASPSFNEIIDEIKELGYVKGGRYIPSNEYSIAINNIRNSYNVRGYIKKVVKLYDLTANLLPEDEGGDFYIAREKRNLLYVDTATASSVIDFDSEFGPLYETYVYAKIKSRRGQNRYVDFNQGLDARLLTEEKISRLTEINIRPLRIAFDHWGSDPQKPACGLGRETYKKAVTLAARHGLRQFSNYLLYNTDDDYPWELYKRLEMNIDLSDELGIDIYSFPMKYHPITDKKYFRNRDFVGKHWSRKAIRAVQAVLNATHGKIGRGKQFFRAAFGCDLDRFNEILKMPEAFIIERYKYDYEAYKLYLNNGGKRNASMTKDVIAKYGAMTSKWRHAYNSLSSQQKSDADLIIDSNSFTHDDIQNADDDVRYVLSFYRIKRYADI